MKKLNRLLKEKNMTQYKLKLKANLAGSTISDLVNGKIKNPSYDLLNKIARALEISVSELIDENQHKDNKFTNTSLSFMDSNIRDWISDPSNYEFVKFMYNTYMSIKNTEK